jgi:hypothetical protein
VHRPLDVKETTMTTGVVILVVIASILVSLISMPTPGSPPPDPFLPYADLLTKGHILDALESRKFSCEFALLEASQLCSFKPHDDLFSKINVIVNEQSVPEYITFVVEKDAIRMGDLIALWGRPNRLYPHIESTVMWTELDGFTVTALVPSADRLNYLAPVWAVSFAF